MVIYVKLSKWLLEKNVVKLIEKGVSLLEERHQYPFDRCEQMQKIE